MEHSKLAEIEKKIYFIRNVKVMIDSDLAELYGVSTGQLNRAVTRNPLRFPEDFAFTLSPDETRDLLTLKKELEISERRKRGQTLVFTENGVAMLSSVLQSERAVIVNVAIMRIFTKLRSFLFLEENLNDRVNKLESKTSKVFKVVFERLDEIDQILEPRLPERRKKIGLKNE